MDLPPLHTLSISALENGAAASVAGIKREEYVAKPPPADIADSLSNLMQKLDVDSIEMKRNAPGTPNTIVLDDTDGPGSSSASTPCSHVSRGGRNMRRAASGMSWNYGKSGIADDSDNPRRKKRVQKEMARMMYLNYRLVPMPDDEPESDEDNSDLATDEMVKLVTSYRADPDKAFDAMYKYLADYTHSEVVSSAESSVTDFVEAAYADKTQVAQAPESKPVVQVVSADDNNTASYQLYLEKASAVAMHIRVEVMGQTRTWKMAASGRLPKDDALEQIKTFVTERGVIPAAEFNNDEVGRHFRDHLLRKSADTE